MGRREWDAATTTFEKCTALNPQEARGYDALGYIYFQTKADGKALEMYSGMVQRYPDVATYRNSLGSVYLMMEKYPQAIAQFQTAIRLDPSEPRFHLHLSKAYEQAGDSAKAEEEYHRYQSLKSPEK